MNRIMSRRRNERLKKKSLNTPESGSTREDGWFFSMVCFLVDRKQRHLLHQTYGDNRIGSSIVGRTRTISSAIYVHFGAGASLHRSRKAFSNIPDMTNYRSKSVGPLPRCHPAGGLPIQYALVSRTRFCFPSHHRYHCILPEDTWLMVSVVIYKNTLRFNKVSITYVHPGSAMVTHFNRLLP